MKRPLGFDLDVIFFRFITVAGVIRFSNFFFIDKENLPTTSVNFKDLYRDWVSEKRNEF
jgi:hypothetical protein